MDQIAVEKYLILWPAYIVEANSNLVKCCTKPASANRPTAPANTTKTNIIAILYQLTKSISNFAFNVEL